MDYGFYSVIPPLVTIVLALALRNVFAALLAGIFLGSMTVSADVFSGVNLTFNSIVKTFASSGNTTVILSLLLIGAMLHLIERSGGIEGFVDIMVHKKSIIRSKKLACFFTWLFGDSHLYLRLPELHGNRFYCPPFERQFESIP